MSHIFGIFLQSEKLLETYQTAEATKEALKVLTSFLV
jgi:hypothetical protein